MAGPITSSGTKISLWISFSQRRFFLLIIFTSYSHKKCNYSIHRFCHSIHCGSLFLCFAYLNFTINLNVMIHQTTSLVQMVGHLRWPLVLLDMPLEWVLSTIPWTHLHGLQAVARQTCISMHISHIHHVLCIRNCTIVYHMYIVVIFDLYAQFVFHPQCCHIACSSSPNPKPGYQWNLLCWQVRPPKDLSTRESPASQLH